MPTVYSAHRPRRVRINTVLPVLAAVVLVLAALTACGPKKGSGGCVFVRPKTAAIGSAYAPAAGQPAQLPMPRPRPPKPKPTKTKERKKNCTKQNSPVWNSFKPYKNGVRTNGEKGKNARYYDWDNTHNDIEVYGPGSSYKHLGSMDPETGNMYKGPVPKRNLHGKLG